MNVIYILAGKSEYYFKENNFFFRMAAHYFSLVLLKEAVLHLICNKTGLPYEEADARCSATECSVKNIQL